MLVPEAIQNCLTLVFATLRKICSGPYLRAADFAGKELPQAGNSCRARAADFAGRT
jgi:hypothetical protein